MEAIKRKFTLFLIVALAAFGAAVADEHQQDQDQQAQEEPQTETRTVEIRGEEVAPLGEIQVGESQQYDGEARMVEVEVETGALVFTTDSASDQHPNVDLVGPNGYYERFEIADNADEQLVVEGLLPGVYSVAVSDEGLQLAHTLVEVTAGQAISVQVALQELAAYQEGAFQADARTAYPDNAFEGGEPQAIENAEFGEVTVETENDDARFVVSGPNGYSQEFTGSFTANDLPPGVYVIAGTREGSFEISSLQGSQIATSAVEVNVSQAVTFVPVYDFVGAETEEVEAVTEEVEAVTDEVEGDVAGGGEAEEGQEEGQAEGEDGVNVDVEQEGEAEGEVDGDVDVEVEGEGEVGVEDPAETEEPMNEEEEEEQN
ncbi:MAG: hypothetical protein WD273_11725 [Trueperaceae bacterium]